MQLNPSEISELIRSRIQNLDTGAQARTEGTVVSVTDGICRVHGLSNAMAGEMLNEAKGRSSEIIAQGEKLKSETIDAARVEAKAEADRIIAGAKAEIEQEIARAKEALRNQVADLAVAGARRILEREIDPKAHAELLADIQRQL